MRTIYRKTKRFRGRGTPRTPRARKSRRGSSTPIKVPMGSSLPVRSASAERKRLSGNYVLNRRRRRSSGESKLKQPSIPKTGRKKGYVHKQRNLKSSPPKSSRRSSKPKARTPSRSSSPPKSSRTPKRTSRTRTPIANRPTSRIDRLATPKNQSRSMKIPKVDRNRMDRRTKSPVNVGPYSGMTPVSQKGMSLNQLQSINKVKNRRKSSEKASGISLGGTGSYGPN